MICPHVCWRLCCCTVLVSKLTTPLRGADYLPHQAHRLSTSPPSMKSAIASQRLQCAPILVLRQSASSQISQLTLLLGRLSTATWPKAASRIQNRFFSSAAPFRDISPRNGSVNAAQAVRRVTPYRPDYSSHYKRKNTSLFYYTARSFRSQRSLFHH